MLNTFRARVGMLNVARLPMKLQAQTEQQATRVQHVRFHQKQFNFRRFAINTAGWCASLYIFNHIVLGGLDKVAGKVEASLSEDEKAEIDEEPAPFIPFPGTTKKMPVVPYRGSDPEWQEFVKFNRDPKRIEQVKIDLAEFLRALYEKDPRLWLGAGKGGKVRRVWLDVDYPRQPPAEFQRSGLEFDDNIYWTTRTVDHKTLQKINNVLWPVATATAFYEMAKTLSINLINGVITSVGFDPERQPTLEALIARQESVAARIAKEKDKGSQSSMTANTTHFVKDPNDIDTAPAPAPEEHKPQTALERRQAALAEFFKTPIQAFQMGFAGGTALLASKRLSSRFEPPRGCIRVTGLVEIDAPKALFTFDVEAAYDPKAREFDKRMNVKMRKVQAKSQKAAR